MQVASIQVDRRSRGQPDTFPLPTLDVGPTNIYVYVYS